MSTGIIHLPYPPVNISPSPAILLSRAAVEACLRSLTACSRVAGYFTRQTNDNRLLCDQQDLQLLDVAREFNVHPTVLSRVIFGYQATQFVLGTATRYPPAAWITGLASDVLSLHA